MVKLPRPAAKVLSWFIKQVHRDYGSGSQWAQFDDMQYRSATIREIGHSRGSGTAHMLLENSGTVPQLRLEELEQLIDGQLTGQPPAEAQGKLIDQIVDILQSDRGRNVLSGRTLEALRNCLFMPAEMGVLMSRLRGHQMCCTGCGKEFNQWEAAVFTGEDFRCLRCNDITTMPCAHEGCTEPARLTKKHYIVLSKKPLCDHHQAVEKGIQPPEPSGQPEQPPPDPIPAIQWWENVPTATATPTIRVAQAGRGVRRMNPLATENIGLSIGQTEPNQEALNENRGAPHPFEAAQATEGPAGRGRWITAETRWPWDINE